MKKYTSEEIISDCFEIHGTTIIIMRHIELKLLGITIDKTIISLLAIDVKMLQGSFYCTTLLCSLA